MATTHRLGIAVAACLSIIVAGYDHITATCSSFTEAVVQWITSPFIYLGSLLFSIEWKPAADVHLEADGALRSVQADTLDLTPLGERFKAFIRRRMAHDEAWDGGFAGAH